MRRIVVPENIIRNRGRSTIQPNQIPGLIVDLDADIGTTIATGVSNWADQSGNGNSLAQGTGGLQPSLVTTGPNGHKAVRFSGSQWLQGTFTNGVTSTNFLVYKSITIGAPAVNDTIFDGKTSFANAYGSDTTPRSWFYNGVLISAATVLANTVYAYVTVQFAGAASQVRSNGVQAFTGNPGIVSTPAGLTLGASGGGTRGANFEITRKLVYNRALLASEILIVEQFLKLKYNL